MVDLKETEAHLPWTSPPVPQKKKNNPPFIHQPLSRISIVQLPPFFYKIL